jgi:DNA-binding MarR family transcriptional regulator
MQDPALPASSAFDTLFIEVIALAGRLKRPMLPQGAGLDVGPRRVLQILAHEGPLTVPQIGRLLGTSRQNIQVIVNRLKADGWIEIVLNPAHERSVLIQSTESGKSLVTPSIAEETRIFGELNAQFSKPKLAAATNLLHQIRQRLEQQRSLSATGIATNANQALPSRTGKGSSRSAAEPSQTSEPVEPSAAEDYELPVNLL